MFFVMTSKYLPRGKKHCANCTLKKNDCSSLSFENMPIFAKQPDYITVNCTHFDREKKMSNNLSGLNDILFEQLNRLNESKDEQLGAEINRSKAIGLIAANIINNAKLALDASRTGQKEMPDMIGFDG